MKTQNYESVNPACDASQNWCLSCKTLKQKKQATVQLSNGKEYKYISRFPVKEGDVVIVGNSYVSGSYDEPCPMGTTGMFGVVTEVLSKIEIKRKYAAELDFVFSKLPDKKLIEACADYLEQDDYEAFQYGAWISPIRPVTHYIRKILAAVSILANKELASTDMIELANQCVYEKPVLDVNRVAKLVWGAPEYIGVDFEQVFFTTDYSELKALLPGEQIEIEEMMEKEDFYNTLSNPQLLELIAKYSFVGAFSIMSRGEFVNLLEAALGVEMPIKGFYDKLQELAKEVGSPKCLELLEKTDYVGMSFEKSQP